MKSSRSSHLCDRCGLVFYNIIFNDTVFLFSTKLYGIICCKDRLIALKQRRKVVVTMKTEFEKAMSESYRKDLLISIEEAKEGLLSPYWREYCYREIMPEKGTNFFPDDGNELFAQLESAYASRSQISNYEKAKQEAESFGGTLLYYYDNKDHYTFVELIHVPDKRTYTLSVSIDRDGSYADLTSYAQRMESSLDSWLASEGIRFDKRCVGTTPIEYELSHFDSLSGALQYLYTALRFPERFCCS